MTMLPVLLLSFVVGCAFLMLTAGDASAATAYSHLGSFGGSGSGDGQFTSPNRIAVDSNTGNIFVADTGNDRIQVFEPTASGADYLTSFGSGILASPIGVAVDSDTGDVYVTDNSANAIFKFSSDGAETPTYTEDEDFTSPAQGTGNGQIGSFGITAFFGSAQGGIAVDPTTGDIVIADPGRNLIQRFDPDGAFVNSFNGFSLSPLSLAFSGIRDLAVDSTGDVIVADVDGSGEGRIRRFSGSGAFQATIGPVPNPAASNGGVVLGADPAVDEVLASSKSPALGDPGQIYRFGHDDAAIDSFGVSGNSLNGVLLGLAASGTDPGRIYVLATNALLGGAPAVQIFEAVLSPTAELDPVDAAGITGTEAKFTGRVNPNGSQVLDCHFAYASQAQFADNGFAGAEQVSCEPAPGDGTAPAEVEATAQNLDPNTDYVVRLVASKGGGATDATAERSFRTDALPPAVTTGRAWSVTDTSATLAARVNPRNSATTYRFEYIDEADFQAHGFANAVGAPDPADDAGTGGSSVQVTVDIDGLEPETDYRFRVVAENGVEVEAGVTEVEGSPASFTTRSSAEAKFPERGYELVSAADTNGVLAVPDVAAVDGDSYAYMTYIPAPGSTNGALSYYRATRNSDGSWSHRGVGQGAPSAGERVIGTVPPPLYSDDLSALAFGTGQRMDPDDQNGVDDAYLQGPSGDLTWLSRDPRIASGTPQLDSLGAGQVQYISGDGNRIVFRSLRHLLAADASAPGRMSLYMWEGGDLSLVGSAPGEEGSISGGTALGSSNGVRERQVTKNAVSEDGSRIAFQDTLDASAGTANPHLYVRIGGESTVDASASAPGVSPPVAAPQRVNYWGADLDMDRVVFTSSSALTVDSEASEGNDDLYAYAVPADGEPGHGELTDLTPFPGGAGVSYVLDVSDDARRIYFTSDKQLISGKGEPDGPNIYLAEVGDAGQPAQLTYIATGELDLGGVPTENWRNIAANADGSTVAFRSVEPLVPGRRTGGKAQIYAYNAERNELNCVSCPADGSAPSASAHLTPSIPVGDRNAEPHPVGDGQSNGDHPHIRNVSADGSVLFQTGTRLTQQDSDTRIDVYEYRGGRVSLISHGSVDAYSIVAGASADGETLFFASADSFAGAQPGILRIYAARIGGGYEPPSVTPPCEGDDCRDEGSGAPDDVDPGSGEFTGPGNAAGKDDRANRCVRLERRAKQARRKARRAKRAARRLSRWARRLDGKRAARTERRAKHVTRQARRKVKTAQRSARAANRCRRQVKGNQ